MNSLFPNMRLVCLPSFEEGKDWQAREKEIDKCLTSEGLELAEESVYLFFGKKSSLTPSEKDLCFIGRPVIGPKKQLSSPFVLRDFESRKIYSRRLLSNKWGELLTEVNKKREELCFSERHLSHDFIICLHRRLRPALELESWAIFYE